MNEKLLQRVNKKLPIQITKALTKEIIECVLQSHLEVLLEDESITTESLGKFEIKTTKERSIKSIDGTIKTIQPKKAIRWRLNTHLRKVLNESD